MCGGFVVSAPLLGGFSCLEALVLDLPVVSPVPIELYAGDDAVREFTLTGPGGPVVFDGVLSCQWRRFDSSVEFVPVPVESDGPGHIRLVFAPDLTRDIKASGVLDVQGVGSSTITYLRAAVAVQNDVTRDDV